MLPSISSASAHVVPSSNAPKIFRPRLGQATVRRHAGGWMFQFGHIYALHQELTRRDQNWFRAFELWHVARHEGVTYNTHNYGSLLQLCNRSSQWTAALRVVSQMAHEGVSTDTTCAHNTLVAAVKAGQWQACLGSAHYFVHKGVEFDEMCTLAVVRAAKLGGQWEGALHAALGTRLSVLQSPKYLPAVESEVVGYLTDSGMGDLAMQLMEHLAVRNQRFQQQERKLMLHDDDHSGGRGLLSGGKIFDQPEQISR
eukprot:PhM_4_TR17308/c0_g1_i1/m.12700